MVWDNGIRHFVARTSIEKKICFQKLPRFWTSILEKWYCETHAVMDIESDGFYLIIRKSREKIRDNSKHLARKKKVIDDLMKTLNLYHTTHINFNSIFFNGFWTLSSLKASLILNLYYVLLFLKSWLQRQYKIHDYMTI